MSEFPHLDNKTLSILKYISNNEQCKVRTLLQAFDVKKIEDCPDIIASLLHFIDKGFVALLLPDGGIISTYNFREYSNQCVIYQKGIINADYQLLMLPEGRYIIEEIKRQNRYFNIPVVISIVSAAISASSLLYQVFDNAPVLVKILDDSPILIKILECLPK